MPHLDIWVCVPAEGSSQPLRLRWKNASQVGISMSSDERGRHGTRPSRSKEFKRLLLVGHGSRSWTGSFQRGRTSNTVPGISLKYISVRSQSKMTRPKYSLTFVELWERSLVKCSGRGSHVQGHPAKVTTGEFLSRTEIWSSKTDRTVSLKIRERSA